ncbi:MAG: hypothetical protein OEW15_02825 [Nitrospirota bacterium]|nr:hypothetical protein [Nitrospirota bacterium]
MIDIKYCQRGAVGVLTLGGDLGKQSECDIRSALAMSLRNADSLVIDLEKVDNLDSACCELLCRTIETHRNAKRLSVGGKYVETLKERIRLSGYACMTICRETGECRFLRLCGEHPWTGNAQDQWAP